MVDEEEVWKVYPEYPFIEVSNLGRIRTKDRVVTDRRGRKYHIKGRVLKQELLPSGYLFVHFNANGKIVNLRVHRAVAICFIHNPNNLPEVNHIDNDRTNNVVSNLEWCSHQENITHREKCGIPAKEFTKVTRKPVFAVDLNSLEIFLFESRMEAARKLELYGQNIDKVIKGYYSKTGDYWFCNADETAIEKVRAKFSDEVAEKVEKLMNENYNF